VARFAGDLAALPIRIEPPHEPASWNDVVQVATKHKLTIYDAAYLELAERVGLPLATLDGDLRKAARAKGAPLVEET
jgi:predicted nucleic acid-binding protein